MLVDIFATRYSKVPIWGAFAEVEQKLLVQCFRVLSEDVCPYHVKGNPTQLGPKFWEVIQEQLSRELGLKTLSPSTFAYPFNKTVVSGTYTPFQICEKWMFQTYDGSIAGDRFVKERLSLIEIGFRRYGDDLATARSRLAHPTPLEKLTGDLQYGAMRAEAARRTAHEIKENKFREAVDELNARFRQAECDLHYHNGFIQRSTEPLAMKEIEAPFWGLVAEEKWANVDVDMKEAFDRRDGGEREPAFYAARALESTIKIISGEKGWTHGKEKGAHNFIDNLIKGSFVADWEAEAMKLFFSKVRNPLGHGPGKEPMSNLTRPQTDWAIETCIVWINSLIRRF